MSASALSTAWYRFQVTWRHLRGGYLALVLLVGLVGGLALGSVAAARRTASSFSTFLAATNPSDLTIEPAGAGPQVGQPYAANRLIDAVRRFPHVAQVESYVALNASLLKSRGVRASSLESSVLFVGSVDGLLFNQDRFTITSGRMANPKDPSEVMVTQTAAAALGVHLGETLRIAVSPTTSSGPVRRLRLTISGIGVLNREVVQDQIARFPTYIVATPALTRSLLNDAVLVYLGVKVQGGSQYVPAVERRWNSTERYFTDFQVASQTVAEAEQSIRPEALALGVFGGIAGLAALLLAIQAIARQLAQEMRICSSCGRSEPALPRLCSTA